MLFNHLCEHWLANSQSQKVIINQDEVRDQLWERLNNKQEKPNYGLLIQWRSILKYAAVIGLAFAFFHVFYDYQLKNAYVAPQETIIKSNLPGVKSTIYLTDGSKIILNAGSEVRYHKAFSTNKREVWLDGEAFFEVAENKEKPFVVYSGELEVEALGTEFNVSNLFNKELVSVSLSEGKVAVRQIAKQLESIILQPGEQVNYDHQENNFSAVIDYDKLLVEGWKSGVLAFNHADLQKIKSRLELWYGVDIVIENFENRELSYSGKFENQSLENVLLSMGFVLDFKFELDGKKVFIKF